jgi:YfiH family protein
MREVPLAPQQDGTVAWIPLGSGEEQVSMQAGISLRAAGDLRRPGPGEENGDETAGGCTIERQRFLRHIGVAESRVAYCSQVHSRTVLWIDEPSYYPGCDGDGLLSPRGETVLAVTVGDCLPIFLADRLTGSFGILHSGWKGTGILAHAVEMLRGRGGARPGDISVTLGPGIGSCCYEVELTRYELFLRMYGPTSVRRVHDRLFLDLQAANLQILESAGVEDVTVVRACSCCTPALSSFRRDGPLFAHMIAFVGYRSEV